jgi:prune family protein 2
MVITTSDLESNYFLPQSTIDKLDSVFDSINFTNLYTLSGELKHILSPIEIQEILANKDQLKNVISPAVMAALAFAPPEKQCILTPEEKQSKSSSISNGFHSDSNSEGSEEDEKNAEYDQNSNSSLRRKIQAPFSDLNRYVESEELPVQVLPEKSSLSIENLEPNDESGVYLVRRDSKRFNSKDSERIVQGLFVESSNKNGTLKRIKVPLHLGDEEDELYSRDSSLVEVDLDEAKTPQKKKIVIDDGLLSTASELDSSQATDQTQADVFYSIINSLSRNQDQKSGGHSDDTEEDVTLDIDTPDDMEDSILGKLDSIAIQTPNVEADPIPDLPLDEDPEDSRWRPFRIGSSDIQIDLKAIQPYRRVLSHGGYFDVEKKVAIILFSGCFLPDRSRREYGYLMDHLFLYVLSTLEELIVEDYMLVYLHGATPKSCQPTFGWLKRCYQLIDRKLRKNLKGLYLVHPTFWLRTVVACTKPFISTKFSRKVQFVNTLANLCLEIPTEHLVIPDCVLQFDFDLKCAELKRQKQMV